MNQILLPLLLLTPFVAGFLCWVVDHISWRLPRYIALAGMTVCLLIVIALYQTSSSVAMPSIGAGDLPVWSHEFTLNWIPQFGISFHLAIDGLSLIMLGLTSLLGILAVACSWQEIQKNVGFFHLNLLWSLAGVIGVFMAMDLFLFFFFWEMMLVPIYFLIALWGHKGSTGKSRVYAATKFFIFTQVSGLIMLVGILALVIFNFAQTGVMSFSYEHLLATTQLPYGAEYAIMLCFFIGFAVKLPIVPFHGWLPDAHAQAPTAGSVDLAGILIKTAAYGLIRFVLPLFPNASMEFAPIAIALGTIGIFYGAWLAFMQTDIKRLLAYTSISHMGFVVIGVYTGTALSLQGVTIQMVAHGLSSAALFIMAGQVYERLHTRDLTQMGGLWGEMRYLPAFMMFFCAALLGIPGTGNFIGEFLILLGAFDLHPVAVILALISLVFAGLYSLIVIHRMSYGKTPEQHKGLRDFNARELSMMSILVAGLLWIGLYPAPLLNQTEQLMQWTEQTYRPAPLQMELENKSMLTLGPSS